MEKKFDDRINIRLLNLLQKYYENEKTASIFIKYEPVRMRERTGCFHRQQHCALEYKQAINAMQANVFNTFPIIFLFYYRSV